MNYSAIAVRYSKALFTLAEEKGKLTEVQQDIELIKSVCETNNEFKNLLDFPIVQASKKISIFTEIFGKRVNPLTLEFLKLTANNKRESYLLPICYSFINLYKEKQGIKTVNFISVEGINENIKKEVIKLVKNSYKADIELVEHTNEQLIGGFVLRVDDEQFDASVANHLRNIEKELINN